MKKLHVQIPLFFLAAFSLGFGIWQSHFYDYIMASTPIPSAPIYVELVFHHSVKRVAGKVEMFPSFSSVEIV